MKQKTVPLALISSLILSALSALAATPAAEANSPAFQFNADLHPGMTLDPDVKYLQQVLDSNAATMVAASGPGSASQPTTYFGEKTKAAVMNFQSLYRADILVPAGLSSPTGTAGPKTRAKLNQLIASGMAGVLSSTLSANISGTLATNATHSGSGTAVSAASALAPTDGSFMPTFAAGTTSLATGTSSLTLSGFSSYRVIPGQVMSVFAKGLDSLENTVYVGTASAGTYSADSSGGSVTFAVPSVPHSGSYQVAISNKYGTSTSGSATLEVDATPSGTASSTSAQTPVPTLISLTPKDPSYSGAAITLTGTGFLPSNLVITNMGNVDASSTDGKTITFRADSLGGYGQMASRYSGQIMTLNIRVSNKNGTSIERVNHPVILAASKGPSLGAYNGTGAASSYVQQASDSSLGQYASAMSGAGTMMGAEILADASASGAGSSGSSGSSASIPTYFGGMIEYNEPCTCGAGSQLLYIDDYGTDSIVEELYQPGVSSLRQYGNLEEGSYTIGGVVTEGSATCYIYEGVECSSGGEGEGIIDFDRGIGTSE